MTPAKSITAPWPAKMPRGGKVTDVVKPVARAESKRRSEVLTRSAARTQLVVEGRSWGPRAGGLVEAAGAAGFVCCCPPPPRPPVAVVGGAASGLPVVLQ